MKNFYALIHFGGNAVSGFLAIGHEDAESARLSIIKDLTDEIHKITEQYKDDEHNWIAYGASKVSRLKSFRKCFTKPHRIKKGSFGRENPSLEMVELPNNFNMGAGYWLSHKSDEGTGHICNLAREKEEHPKMGYVISKLK